MRVNDNDVKTMINEYYRDQHPELNITKRILDNLIPIVCKGLSETPDSMTIEKAMPAVHKFLEKENILNFIIERQPNMTCIPDQVVKSLKEYFNEAFPGISICHVYRKSNHPDDYYLYTVTAKSSDGAYCCWSSWNSLTESLNQGHYGLKTEQNCIDILQDLFNDITDEPDQYGMQQNVYSNDDEEEKKQIGNEESNIIPINRHRGR